MKKVLAIGLILTIPFFLSAQQNGSSQQDLQKQIEKMKQEVQSQISALRDSIIKLKEQLSEQQRTNSDFDFHYSNPMTEKNLRDWSELDSLLRDHSYSGAWSYSFPAPHSFDYNFISPPSNSGDQFDWKQFEVPPCPEVHKQKHKHEWMKMLPFYNFFNK